jgi:DNA-damage-inducible protein D
MTNAEIKLFEEKKVRRIWDAEKEQWYFSITDIIAILTESKDPLAYWRKFKERLKKEGIEPVTICHVLKMPAADGKMRDADVAHVEQLLRLIQSIPSPKAEPFKQWLAKVGYERMEGIMINYQWLMVNAKERAIIIKTNINHLSLTTNVNG